MCQRQLQCPISSSRQTFAEHARFELAVEPPNKKTAPPEDASLWLVLRSGTSPMTDSLQSCQCNVFRSRTWREFDAVPASQCQHTRCHTPQLSVATCESALPGSPWQHLATRISGAASSTLRSHRPRAAAHTETRMLQTRKSKPWWCRACPERSRTRCTRRRTACARRKPARSLGAEGACPGPPAPPTPCSPHRSCALRCQLPRATDVSVTPQHTPYARPPLPHVTYRRGHA